MIALTVINGPENVKITILHVHVCTIIIYFERNIISTRTCVLHLRQIVTFSVIIEAKLSMYLLVIQM